MCVGLKTCIILWLLGYSLATGCPFSEKCFRNLCLDTTWTFCKSELNEQFGVYLVKIFKCFCKYA
jgi:hypothetical protein